MANGQSTVEQSLMQPFAVLATAFNPAGDGGVVMAEDAASSGDVNPYYAINRSKDIYQKTSRY